MVERICAVPGCESTALGRLMCSSHYQRQRKYGDPLGGGPPNKRPVDYPDASRRCTECGERKALDGYQGMKGGTLGRRSKCRECVSARKKAYYARHCEEIKARAAIRYADNPEPARARSRAKNKLPENLAKQALRNERRRAQVAGARVDIGLNRHNLRQQYGDLCFYCEVVMSFARRRRGDPFGPDMATMEHVVPIAMGGTHTWDNVVLACWTCNSSKRHMPLQEWLSRSRTGQISAAT